MLISNNSTQYDMLGSKWNATQIYGAFYWHSFFQIALDMLVNSTEQDKFGCECIAAQRQGAFDFYIFKVQIVGEMMLNNMRQDINLDIMLGCEWNAA